LIREIVENPSARHKLIIGTGTGTRRDMLTASGLISGPHQRAGVLGTFVQRKTRACSTTYYCIMAFLSLSPQFAQLPHYLAERGAVIFFSMPPYIYWQTIGVGACLRTEPTPVVIW
jgi:molybdenum storage protein